MPVGQSQNGNKLPGDESSKSKLPGEKVVKPPVEKSGKLPGNKGEKSGGKPPGGKLPSASAEKINLQKRK